MFAQFFQHVQNAKIGAKKLGEKSTVGHHKWRIIQLMEKLN